MSQEAELKAAIEEQNKLVRKMLDPETGLQAKIDKMESEGKGVADLKEQMNKMVEDNAKAIDRANEIEKALTERQDEFEAKLSGGKSSGPLDPYAGWTKSYTGSGITEKSGTDLQMALRGGVKANFGVDAVFGAKTVTSAAASAGDAIVPVYEQMIRPPGEQGITLLDVLPRTRTESPLIYWVVEVLGSRTDNAGIQSLDFTGTDQGTALGESDFVFNQLSAETRTFGHTAKIAIQTLEDVSQMQGYLANRMVYMARFDLENQILAGNGSGKNISGLKNQATAYDTTLDSDLSVTNLQKLDVLKLAFHQCALTFFPATAAIVHPDDATSIALLKDGNYNYLWTDPRGDQMPRPWGVPLVQTTQQTTDEFTVGAMNQVEVAVRRDVQTLISTENEDDFDKELATIKVTGRAGLKVYQPTSIIDGDFTTALA